MKDKKILIWKYASLCFFLITFSFQSYSQEEQNLVSGTVLDETGIPLPGATVTIKGEEGGAITNFDGNFEIRVKMGQIVVVSFLGMEDKEVEYSGQQELEVSLEPKADALEELTIVAYGQQRKEAVVGAVTTIEPEELKVPSSNLTTSFAGRLPGLIAYQRSGEPGFDNADFFIRGVTTFGYKQSPLILIDGIELTTTDLARLQPDDIASFSIMKDATATALYGARGANGVILVKTKEGKEGAARLNVRYEKSISMPTKNIDIADPITFMKLHNEAAATRDPLGGRIYSLEQIRMTEQPDRNEMAYPAVDWFDKMFKNHTFNDRLNFNVSGGGDVARYYLASTINTDTGILKVDNRNNFNNNVDFKRISLRSNINIDVTKTTEVSVRFNGNFDDYTGPLERGEDLFRKALQTNPVLYPMYYDPDERFANSQHILFGNAGETGDYLNPYADMVRGYKDESRNMLLATVEIFQDLNFITEGLNARVMGNTTRESFFNVSRAYNPFYYSINNYDPQIDRYSLFQLNPDSGTEFLQYDEGDKIISTALDFQADVNYERTFNEKHKVTGLLLGVLREEKIANAGNLQLSLPYRNIGLSGRFTYGYDSRYIAEFNFGYNGSERFAASKRYGFFPSAGLAWNISNEKFWEPYQNVINKLKFRATYGLVGNDAIGSPEDRFFYISQLNMNNGGAGTAFGQNYSNNIAGISIDRYPNEEISWETAKKTNIGVELGLFNKWDLLADFFYEDRTNVLMNRTAIPATMGLQAPLRANVGAATSKGFEATLEYSDNITDEFYVSGRFNMTYATNEFTVYDELDFASIGMPWKSYVGKNINQNYGLIAERLFVDEADIAISPRQEFGDYMPGDIKYKDINGDGVINSTYDIVPIGYPTVPEIIYGFGLSSIYKNFDLSFFFQGSARSSFFIDPYNTAPFIDTDANSQRGSNALLSVWAEDYWSEDNRDLYAAWPRLSNEVVENNNQNSTWFLRDGAFLRLKSAEFGYTIPEDSFMEKIGVSSTRLYFSGTNLLTFSKFKLWDVEMGGNGLGYPIQKVFNFGAIINF